MSSDKAGASGSTQGRPTAGTALEAASERKYLKWYNKVGYGSGDVAGNVVYVLLSAFVMIYLTDTAGLNAGVVGTLMMVSRLFDGFSDIIFGALLDRTSTRMGKARPWMLWGFVGCAAMIIAIFAIPTSLGDTAKYAWFFIAYTLLNAVFYTANNIAYSSLTALITRNSDERVQMGSIRFMFAFGTNLLIQSITVGGVALFGGGAVGWRTMAIIYALLGLAVNTLSVLSVEELPPEELESEDEPKDDKLSVAESAKLLLSNKYYLIILVVFLLTQIFTAMLNMGIYFMTYILNDANLLGTFAWAINIPLIVGLMVTPVVVSRFGGMYRINIVGYVIATVGRLGVLVAAYTHNIPLMLVLSGIAALGMSPLQGTLNALIAEASENTWLRTGKRIDGLMFSCTSLGVKVGGGLGTAVSGWLLAASGYDGHLDVQPGSAIQMLYVMYVWFPLVANALILFLLTRLDVEKVNTGLKEQLDAQAAGKAGEGADGEPAAAGAAGEAGESADAVESLGSAAGIKKGDDSTS
ncbi:MFS transporter [Actinomyces viscosus]|uniref:Glucuronide permease n=1 Tax=Actinomyces viscosus TaxID=1656 RepID=A0A3S4XAM2_ACTVI|nr:glycoside-pentoside-hexuronide (GPH):cation symporter [Actinomyces viscosus]TFH51784.1 MFS transporter [Actinomyces viscosus]VEI17474.1 Glucuronide permease [Actinomyces viscosus]